MRVLHTAGLVRHDESRQVRGGTEQYFALVSRGLQVHEDASVGPEFLINAALADMLPADPDEPSHTELRHLWLTDAEADALEARLRAPVPLTSVDDSPVDRPDRRARQPTHGSIRSRMRRHWAWEPSTALPLPA